MTSIINLAALSGSSVFSKSEDKWYENVSYEDSKDLIREKINSAKSSLVSIGYYLKHIKNHELYKEDGYTNIHEFAKAEFGFNDNTTDRYMQLNDQFSIGGNSPEIEEKYSSYNMSQLFEMLPMKEEDRESLSSDMTVKEIRQAKKDIAENNGPSDHEIALAYSYIFNEYEFNKYGSFDDFKKSFLIVAKEKGRTYEGGGDKSIHFGCSPRGITINKNDEITWNVFCKRVWTLIETMPSDDENKVSIVRPATEEEKEKYNKILDNVKKPDPVVEGMTDIPDFSEDSKPYEKYEEISELSDEELLKELISKQESLLMDMRNAFTDDDIRVRKQKILVNALHRYAKENI